MLLRKDGAEIDISLTVLPDLPPLLAAKVLGIDRRTLYRKLEKYKL